MTASVLVSVTVEAFVTSTNTSSVRKS